jgi:drug/metabolite transporter (DMT)-like permease
LRTAAFRFLLAALLCLWTWRKFPRGRALAVTLVLSVTMVALPLVLLRWVQPQLPSATVAVLFAAMPLLLSFPGPRAAMQASIVALVAMAFTLEVSFSLAQAGAAAVVLFAVASIAASSLAVRRELSNENPVAVTAVLLGAAGLLLLLASLAMERGQTVQWNRESMGALIYLGGVAGAGAYATYVWLLQRVEAYQATTVQWIQPLVAVMEGAWLLGLRPSLLMIAGAVVTLGCLLVVVRARSEDDDSVSLLGN